MLKHFEERYLFWYRELQKQQWSNYFEEGNHDLSAIDDEIYSLACYYSDKLTVSDRKSQIAEFIIKREKVDKAPEVSKLRNYIDNLSNFAGNIPDEIRKDKFKLKLEMSKRMKKDVLKLMDIRNSLAVNNGYDSYADLVLSTEELDRGKLINLLDSYLGKNIDQAKGIIKKYDITFENWFEDLDRISKIKSRYDPNKLISKLMEMLGFTQATKRIGITYTEGEISGYAGELAPGDIRIAVKPAECLNSLRILFHELGHALSYCLNNEEGLFRILPASLNEPMAVIFEYIAPVLVLNREEKDKISELMTLEYTRCAVSALFEFDLWEEPGKAEILYEKNYSRFGMKINDPDIWAYDSFRSIDPVYIHNYVIGAVIAENMLEYLNEHFSGDYTAWGTWLYHNVYHGGWRGNLVHKALCRFPLKG